MKINKLKMYPKGHQWNKVLGWFESEEFFTQLMVALSTNGDDFKLSEVTLSQLKQLAEVYKDLENKKDFEVSELQRTIAYATKNQKDIIIVELEYKN
jgi:hypothetical protein